MTTIEPRERGMEYVRERQGWTHDVAKLPADRVPGLLVALFESYDSYKGRAGGFGQRAFLNLFRPTFILCYVRMDFADLDVLCDAWSNPSSTWSTFSGVLLHGVAR